jgi:hypothetical protein
MPANNNVPSEPNKASQPAWQPTSAGKQQASTFRIIAVVLWVLAIAGEAFAIFWILKQPHINMVLLIGSIVVIGVLAVVADLLWKRANQFDPASTSEPVRFFIQNQLGAIISLIAFLPLIILIFMNKNMDSKQKGLAGGIGIVVLVIAAMMGVSLKPPSVQQYSATAAVMTSQAASLPQSSPVSTEQAVQQTQVAQSNPPASGQFASESAAVIAYTGADLVFWTPGGAVYHLCKTVSDLKQDLASNKVVSGTVAQAHAAGMTRLTLKVSEELKQCGYNNAPTPTP